VQLINIEFFEVCDHYILLKLASQTAAGPVLHCLNSMRWLAHAKCANGIPLVVRLPSNPCANTVPYNNMFLVIDFDFV